jgi:hypothetical protein
MPRNRKVSIRLHESGQWLIEVPVPDRQKPVLVMAESEEDAPLVAQFLEGKLADGNIFPKVH